MSPPDRSVLHHIGLTVSDLDASTRWYEAVLGVEAGPPAANGGPRLARALGVGPDVRLRYAFFEVGGAQLELVAYDEPTAGAARALRNCDPGAVHICLAVPDLEAARARLSAIGVRFSSEPLELVDGPLVGARFAYFQDPDGHQLQLLQS